MQWILFTDLNWTFLSLSYTLYMKVSTFLTAQFSFLAVFQHKHSGKHVYSLLCLAWRLGEEHEVQRICFCPVTCYMAFWAVRILCPGAVMDWWTDRLEVVHVIQSVLILFENETGRFVGWPAVAVLEVVNLLDTFTLKQKPWQFNTHTHSYSPFFRFILCGFSIS